MAQASLCQNLEMFCPSGAEQWFKMCIYDKVKVTCQDYPSLQVTEILHCNAFATAGQAQEI